MSSSEQNNEVNDLELETTVEKSPRSRPTQTSGVTRRIRTGEGTLYITINEDENGLCEVFTTIGKAGGNAAAQSEAISRLISLSLRSGLDPHAIVRQLKGISGPNPTWEDGRLILEAPVPISTVILGGSVRITTPLGKRIQIEVPELTKIGDRRRVNGHGHQGGDLDIEFVLHENDNLTKKQIEILEQLREAGL